MGLLRTSAFATFAVALMYFAAFDSVARAQKGGGASGQAQTGAPGGQNGTTPFFETEMLAHGALNQLAEAVAQRVCNAKTRTLPPKATIVIFDQQSFQNLGAWQSFAEGAEMLTDAYNTLPTTASGTVSALTASSASSGFIQGGADLGSLISAVAASTSNTASTFTIPDSTMAISLMHQFKRIKCDVNIIYYPLFGSYADSTSAGAKLHDVLAGLNSARTTAQSDLDGATNTEIAFAELNDLNSQYDLLLKDFLTMPGQNSGGAQGQSSSAGSQSAGTPNAASGSTSPGAISLLQGAELDQLIKRDDTYILYADVVAAGGTQRDVKNIFTLITGDWISYSGGVIVNVALIKSKETRLEFSDTLRYRTDFHHRDLWDVLGFKTFDDPFESGLVEKINSASNTTTLCDGQTSKHRFNVSRGGCSITEDRLASLTFDSLRFDHNEVSGGMVLTGTVTLNGEAVRPGLSMDLFSSAPTIFPVPGQVLIEPGSSFGTFTVRTSAVRSTNQVVVSIVDKEGRVHSQVITIYAPLLSLNQNEVLGGNQVHGTIVLPAQAPEDGATVTLWVSDPSIKMISPVQIKKGDITADFDVGTQEVSESKRVVISAVYNNILQSVLLTVNKR